MKRKDSYVYQNYAVWVKNLTHKWLDKYHTQVKGYDKSTQWPPEGLGFIVPLKTMFLTWPVINYKLPLWLLDSTIDTG